MSDAATKEDVLEVHRRIDAQQKIIGEMQRDIGEIRGNTSASAESLGRITDLLAANSSSAFRNSCEIWRTVRWGLVLLGIFGFLLAGMSRFQAVSGDRAIEVMK